MTSEQISIIICAYNRPLLLKRCINSVLKQTYKRYEIIVVDDSTDDESYKIIQSFKDPKIKYFKPSTRRGVSAARNAGLKLAVGDLIAFLDDDDEWLPDRLSRQVNILHLNSQIGIIHSNCYIQIGDRSFLYHSPMHIPSEKDLLKFDNISNITTLIRKSCFDEVGIFDERIPYGEDWDFYIRASKKFQFKYIPLPLAIMHNDEKNMKTNRLGENFSLKVTGFKIFVEKHRKDYVCQEKTLAKHLTFIGSGFCRLGDIKQGQAYLIDAIRVYPSGGMVPLLLLISNIAIFNTLKQTMANSLFNKLFSSNYYSYFSVSNYSSEHALGNY